MHVRVANRSISNPKLQSSYFQKLLEGKISTFILALFASMLLCIISQEICAQAQNITPQVDAVDMYL